MGSSQRAPGDSGRERHCRTLLASRGGSGGDETLEALAAPPTTVLDRPACRPGGRIAIGGVGRSKAILVCLGRAGGAGRVPTGGDAGQAGSPAAHASRAAMNLYELPRGLSLRRRPAAVRTPSSAASHRSAPTRIPSAGVADPVAFGSARIDETLRSRGY